MSKIPIDWIAFFLFLILFSGVIIAEVQWLVRKGGATSGRATGYVMVTDLLGFGIGSFVVLVIFLIMFMMVMGPAGTGGTAPESAYVVTSLIAVIFPPVFLIISKRLFLSIFKIKSGKPWIYSFVSSILIMLIVLVPPPAIYFAVVYLAEWKS